MNKSVVHVQVATGNDNDRDYDMPNKEELIELLADWQDRRWEQDRHPDRSGGSPDPIG